MKAFLLTIISVLCLFGASSQTVSRHLTYVNLSKPNGGPISPGDTLEIRAVLSVRSGTIRNVQFYGIVPTGTAYIPGSLAAKTNEGVTSYPGVPNIGTYTDAFDSDRGTISGTSVNINLGQNADAFGGGNINASTTPTFYGNASIVQACYKVRVTASNNFQLTINNQSFVYGTGGGTTYPLNDIFALVQFNSTCGAYGTTNYISIETNGEFGSGTTQSRSATSIVAGYTYTNISGSNPNDGLYSIVNNSSANGYTGSTPTSGDRVFGVWDVFGDHTGTNNAIGNPPAAIGSNAGYMMIVNAAYTPGLVFSATISGLTPGSLYTMRFWVRNLCSGNCSGAPNGSGGTGPGVLPNMIMYIGGVDRYITGEIPGNGQWIEKSFTFQANNSSESINLRNSAPGGGGNDWAMDDFSIHECLIVLSSAPRNFKAQYINSSYVKLAWSGGEEKMIDSYVVESSENGKDFKAIGTVLPKGDRSNYQFNDNRKVEEKVYYRVKAVNKNGEVEYSSTAIVRGQATVQKLISVTPNPSVAIPALNVWSSSEQSLQILVMDASGRQVVRQTAKASRGENNIKLNSNGSLAPGVYYMKVNFADGNMVTEKFMITCK